MHFHTEWLLLVLPLLLSMTLFANNPGLLTLILLFPTGLLLLIPPRELGTPLPSNTDWLSKTSSPTRTRQSSPARSSKASPMVSVPALTTYRAHMLLMTILSILAVDFPVFPRSLAKCETYGVSLVRLASLSFFLRLKNYSRRWIWALALSYSLKAWYPRSPWSGTRLTWLHRSNLSWSLLFARHFLLFFWAL